MNRVIIITCVLASFYAELDALKCNLCVGSFNSDCANNITSAMTVQTCRHFPGNPFHHHNTERPPPPFPRGAPTPPSNSISGEETTVSAEIDGKVVSPRPTLNYPHPHPHPHPHPKLDVHCLQLKMKADKFIGDSYERGCFYVFEGKDICEFIKKHRNVESCVSCDTDGCN